MFCCVATTEKEKKEISINGIICTYKPNLEQHNPAPHPVCWQVPGAPPPPMIPLFPFPFPQCAAVFPQKPNDEQQFPAGHPDVRQSPAHPPCPCPCPCPHPQYSAVVPQLLIRNL